jgi:hypothetical protein
LNRQRPLTVGPLTTHRSGPRCAVQAAAQTTAVWKFGCRLPPPWSRTHISAVVCQSCTSGMEKTAIRLCSGRRHSSGPQCSPDTVHPFRYARDAARILGITSGNGASTMFAAIDSERQRGCLRRGDREAIRAIYDLPLLRPETCPCKSIPPFTPPPTTTNC